MGLPVVACMVADMFFLVALDDWGCLLFDIGVPLSCRLIFYTRFSICVIYWSTCIHEPIDVRTVHIFVCLHIALNAMK